jgi:hypothetical protein
MAMPAYSPAVLLAALALSVPLAGCGSDDGGPPTPPTPPEVGNTITYSSFGTTADIDCGQGESLAVAGSNNTLTVRGSCSSVSVGGADNTILADRIDGLLAVAGLNNIVSYQQGEPTVNDEGTGNRISRG